MAWQKRWRQMPRYGLFDHLGHKLIELETGIGGLRQVHAIYDAGCKRVVGLGDREGERALQPPRQRLRDVSEHRAATSDGSDAPVPDPARP